MRTFIDWLSHAELLTRLGLIETYFTFDPAQYNRLFDEELEKVIQRVSDPTHRQVLERMRGFDWTSYIAASVRRAGYRDYREGQEKIHDIVVKLLTGALFRGFDERTSGPMDLRFKRSISNVIKNLVEKENNRRRLLPSVPIQQSFEPGAVTVDDLPARSIPDQDERMIDGFRQLLHERLGDLSVAIFDLRMAGGETKSLVGSPTLGNPGVYTIKRVVQQIKQLAREYAVSLRDPVFLQQVERLMSAEAATIQKRLKTGAARLGV